MPEIRNPKAEGRWWKSEVRSPMSEGSPKSEIRNPKQVAPGVGGYGQRNFPRTGLSKPLMFQKRSPQSCDRNGNLGLRTSSFGFRTSLGLGPSGFGFGRPAASSHRQPRPACASMAGFTLIEVVISSALMALIVVSAYLCLQAALSSQKLIEPRV